MSGRLRPLHPTLACDPHTLPIEDARRDTTIASLKHALIAATAYRSAEGVCAKPGV